MKRSWDQRLERFFAAAFTLPRQVLLPSGCLLAMGTATALAGSIAEDLSPAASHAWYDAIAIQAAGGLVAWLGLAVIGMAHLARHLVRSANRRARAIRA